ncbi:MAG: hypothetical protein ABIQ84_04115, partial [Usitatibacter sp.]
MTMADGHHGIIRPDDGVGAEKALEAREELAQGSGSATPGALVEAHDTAAAMVVRLPAVLQQHVEDGRGNAALLHAHAGV